MSPDECGAVVIISFIVAMLLIFYWMMHEK